MESVLRVGDKVLPQEEEFRYRRILFTSEGEMEQEADRRIGAASAVMQSFYWSAVVKNELTQSARLLIYQSSYTPTLTYSHKL